MHSSAAIQTMQENIKEMRKEYDSLTSKDQNGREGTRLKNLIKLTLENIDRPVLVSKGEQRRLKIIDKYSKRPGFSFLTKNKDTNGNGLAPSLGAHHDAQVPSTSFGAHRDIPSNNTTSLDDSQFWDDDVPSNDDLDGILDSPPETVMIKSVINSHLSAKSNSAASKLSNGQGTKNRSAFSNSRFFGAYNKDDWKRWLCTGCKRHCNLVTNYSYFCQQFYNYLTVKMPLYSQCLKLI